MRSIADYERSSSLRCRHEEFVCLDGTRLVFSDERRFARDFDRSPAPEEGTEPNEESGRLLLSAGSVISGPHTLSNPVHPSPSTSGDLRVGHRPPKYGRAALFELSSLPPGSPDTGPWEGLLDVKGCGIEAGRVPDLGGVNTGILFMHEALTELINHHLLGRLFEREGMGLSTVPVYAVVDTGVRARVAWARRRLPCATLVRKAVVRPQDNNELPKSGSEEEAIHQRIECYLLSHGLTTTGAITTLTMVREGRQLVARLNGEVVPQLTEEIIFLHLRSLGLHPPQVFHFANVQIARECSLEPLRACLVDLGHVRACPDLPGHLAIFVQDEPLNWGMTTLKGSDGWPRRAEAGVVDARIFGPRLSFEYRMDDELIDWLRPSESFQKVSDGVVLEALRLAMLVDQGRCPPARLRDEIEDFVQRSWSAAGATAPGPLS